jgi:hypothetical protein
MARAGGDANAFRKTCDQKLGRALNVEPESWAPDERHAFSNFALALNAATDLRTWTPAEKSKLVEVIRAKMAAEEWDYLRLMREHPRLRKALIRLGSAQVAAAGGS